MMMPLKMILFSLMLALCPYFVWKSCNWGDDLSFRAWHIPEYDIGSRLGM